MIIVTKKSDLLAQFDIFSRFFNYAQKCFPKAIVELSEDHLQTLVASVFKYTDWKKLLYDLNPNCINKLEGVEGHITNNDLLIQIVDSLKHERNVNQATVNLINNLLSFIISTKVRSDKMYASWYFLLHADEQMLELITDAYSLFKPDHLNMGNLIDLSMSIFVLRSYSRLFKMAQPEVINQWVLHRNDVIEKKIKYNINMKQTCDFINLGNVFKSFPGLDPSQVGRNDRYVHGERINLVIPDKTEAIFAAAINTKLQEHIVSGQAKRIHQFLIANRSSINQSLSANKLPELTSRKLVAQDRAMILNYLNTSLWLMNQMIGVESYYGFFDLELNQHGLLVARTAYRNDAVLKPYRIYHKTNHTNPGLIMKKMVSSFDMTKILYLLLDHIKCKIQPEIHEYIEAINGAFDRLGVNKISPPTKDLTIRDMSVRIDQCFDAKQIASMD